MPDRVEELVAAIDANTLPKWEDEDGQPILGISPLEVAVHVIAIRDKRTTKARLAEIAELLAATTIEYQRECWRLRESLPDSPTEGVK